MTKLIFVLGIFDCHPMYESSQHRGSTRTISCNAKQDDRQLENDMEWHAIPNTGTVLLYVCYGI